MGQPTKRRGRPLDPVVSEAALRATLELLDEHGYAGLRVGDVADRAGVGLGALYRRWATKQELVVSALRAVAAERAVAPSDDPVADLVEGLAVIAEGLAERGGRLLAVVLAGNEPELAAAVAEAKIVPLREANRERLRRVIGAPHDLETRADIGPALIVYNLLVRGQPSSREQIWQEIIPLMLEGHLPGEQPDR